MKSSEWNLQRATNTHLDRRAWLKGISTVVTGAAAAAALPKASGAAQTP